MRVWVWVSLDEECGRASQIDNINEGRGCAQGKQQQRHMDNLIFGIVLVFVVLCRLCWCCCAFPPLLVLRLLLAVILCVCIVCIYYYKYTCVSAGVSQRQRVESRRLGGRSFGHGWRGCGCAQ